MREGLLGTAQKKMAKLRFLLNIFNTTLFTFCIAHGHNLEDLNWYPLTSSKVKYQHNNL